jgi:hypothetical protein
MDHRAYLPDGVANTGVSGRIPPRAAVATDFQSLRRGQTDTRRFQKRTVTDWLIDILTPVMIFVMVYSVIYFLLDVRYVYLELDKVDRFAALYNTTIRWVAFFFVVGVVALNRLIARDGRQESVIYIIGLAMAIALTVDDAGRGFRGAQLHERTRHRHRIQHDARGLHLVAHEPAHARVLR